MNVCLIGTDIGPSMNGTFVRGHVNNVVRLSREFSRMGHNVHIITNKPGFSHPAFYDKWMNYAQVSYFPTMFPSLKENGPEFMIKALIRIISDSDKSPFDIVNVHSGFPALATLSALSKKFTQLKTVHTLYSPFDYAFNNSILDRLILSRITRFSFSSLDKVVAISENVRRSLISRHIDEDNITVIPPTISEDFLSPQLTSHNVRLSLRIDEGAPVVTYMGGFEESKGLTVLVQIIAAVALRVPQAVFVIALNRPANDSRLKMFEKDLQKHGFSKNVRVVGITDRIVDVLRMGDIFVAPYSHTMGVADYPLAIFEAMALGKVVIAFDVGGISEMLNEEKGIVIQPGCTESFVENVVRVIKNKAGYRRMGKAASQYAVQNFSPEIIATKTIDLFTTILENKTE
jgi:glycosyltransferase involved in cell wall biosynthesis